MNSNSRKLVLLVDDNIDDEMLTLDALRSSAMACDVVVVRDGAEALDWLFSDRARPSSGPDLVLLDLKLPKVNGFEVLRRMRSHPRTELTPTIVLSSSSQLSDIEDSYRCGANSYIRKSMNFEKFTQSMRCAGEYWLQHNEAVTNR
jgi:two-component system, response regulator